MSTDELREALLGVPGIASAEVTERPGDTPIVRLWLDGSRPGEVVQHDVDGVIAGEGYRRKDEPVEPVADVAEGKRMGLGRGLETLIPASERSAPPAHFQEVAVMEATTLGVQLAKVAIEESAAGVLVRVEDSAGGSWAAEVGDGDSALQDSVISAVAGLFGIAGGARLVAIDERLVGDTQVVSVLLERSSGRRYAGAAVVEGGRPYTIGRAAYSAFRDMV
jgi:hypothetical protein